MRPQAHHIKPYHKFPDLGADPTNFITLCESYMECHLRIGHGGYFKMYNPDVVLDAADYRQANDTMRMLLLSRVKMKRVPDVV